MASSPASTEKFGDVRKAVAIFEGNGSAKNHTNTLPQPNYNNHGDNDEATAATATVASIESGSDDDDDETTTPTPSAPASVASTAFREQQALSRDLRERLHKAQQDAHATQQNNIHLMEQMKSLRERKNKNVILLRRQGNKIRQSVPVVATADKNNGNQHLVNNSSHNTSPPLQLSITTTGPPMGHQRPAVVTPPSSSSRQHQHHHNYPHSHVTTDSESFAMTSVTGLTSITLSSDDKEETHGHLREVSTAAATTFVPITRTTSRRRPRSKSPSLLDVATRDEPPALSMINAVIPEEEEDEEDAILQYPAFDQYASLNLAQPNRGDDHDDDEWGALIDQKIALADGLSDMKEELASKRAELEELETAFADRKQAIALEMAQLEALRDELRDQVLRQHGPKPGLFRTFLRKFGFASEHENRATTHDMSHDASMMRDDSDNKVNLNL
eukprot:CAMPEP_0168833140 /NCGR_PEP_ID=MMETSP0727-20121128/2916_1 /TAXON_ID=265536 /ORGANISM="Amphiprora sp., Strain CCMP467" /LENGTH=444 /DNA_ID=CAMNT_0008886439 /DNA_START=189 /DNA_END=1520 /DNA_ORIENTATION=-